MPRLSRIAAVGLVPLALAVPLGCGSSSKKDESGTTKTTRTAPGAETPPPPLPANDGQAYAEIQRDSGVLRAAAVPVAYGTASRIVVADRLNAAARTLTGVKPRNPLLVRLRRQTLAALGKAGSRAGLDETKAKGIAKEAIAEADRIDAGLRRYAALHPAANG